MESVLVILDLHATRVLKSIKGAWRLQIQRPEDSTGNSAFGRQEVPGKGSFSWKSRILLVDLMASHLIVRAIWKISTWANEKSVFISKDYDHN
jgi:hypothetical protein